MKKLKVAFLVSDFLVDHSAFKVMQHVCGNSLFELPTIINMDENGHDKNNTSRTRIRRNFREYHELLHSALFFLLLRFVWAVEFFRKPECRQEVDLRVAREAEKLLVYDTIVVPGELRQLSRADYERINSERFDVIVQCNSASVPRGLIQASNFGILHLQIGGSRQVRGYPGGFWEVLSGAPSSAFKVELLSGIDGARKTLKRGRIMTSATWLTNFNSVSVKAHAILTRTLTDLAHSRDLPESFAGMLPDDRPRDLQDIGAVLKYIWRVWMLGAQKKLWERVFGEKVGRWSVAYAEHGDYAKPLWEYKEIRNPKGRFLADPFVCEYDGRTVVFVEDFCFKDSIGRISAVELRGGEEDFLGSVLEEDFHLSFPYVFENDGTIYMIPETHEARDIRLYKCVDFPTKWQLKKRLMTDVSAADTMMIERHEKWFMLTNICSADVGDHHSELHIFWADSFDSDNWTPIECGNPVMIDSERSRNGGFFFHSDELYRVNQIQGKGHYGQAFSINRVDVLNEKVFSEVRVKKVSASFKENATSTHHFSASSKLAAVDYCREVSLRRAEAE